VAIHEFIAVVKGESRPFAAKKQGGCIFVAQTSLRDSHGVWVNMGGHRKEGGGNGLERVVGLSKSNKQKGQNPWVAKKSIA